MFFKAKINLFHLFLKKKINKNNNITLYWKAKSTGKVVYRAWQNHLVQFGFSFSPISIDK